MQHRSFAGKPECAPVAAAAAMTSASLSVPSSRQADQIVLALLAFVAGFVDGCTMVALFGLFVAQVTGSFVVVGALLVIHEPGALIKVLAIPAFVVGAGVATVLTTIAPSTSRGAVAVLGLETMLLIGLAVSALGGQLTGPDEPRALVAGLCGLAAMGVQGALVRLSLHGGTSTNVMTTNTTQVAIDATTVLLARLAARLPGAVSAPPDARPARERLARTLPIVLAFLAGTLAGAVSVRQIGFVALVLPIAITAGIAIRTARLGE